MKIRDLIKSPDRLKDEPECEKIIVNELKETSNQVSIEFLDKLLEISRKYTLKQVEAWVLHHKGIKNREVGKIEEGLKCCKEAYGLFEEIANRDGLVYAANGMLVLNIDSFRFEEAISWGMTALRLAQEEKHSAIISAIKINLASIYMQLDEIQKARDVLKQVEKLAYFETKESELIVTLNCCICECALKNLEEAQKYFEKSYAIATQYVPTMLDSVWRVQGNIYEEKEEFKDAEESYSQAIEYAIQYNHEITKHVLLIQWAQMLLKCKNYDGAIEKALKVVEASNETLKNLKVCYKLLHEAYSRKGEYEAAYAYLSRYTEIIENREKAYNKCANKLDEAWNQEESESYKVLYTQTEKIYHIGQRLTSKLNTEDILKIIGKELEQLVESERIRIVVLRKEGKNLLYKRCRQDEEKLTTIYENDEMNSLLKHCVIQQADSIIRDMEVDHYRYQPSDENEEDEFFESAIFTHISFDNKVIGAIGIESHKKNAYDLKDLNLLKMLAVYMGIALENARLYKRSEYSANYDALTKVLNRKEVLQRGKKAYEKIVDSDSLSLMMIDIDFFKKVNDTYGHQMGDKVLEKIAKCIARCLRGNDIIGRYGGEEFLVISRIHDLENAKLIAERVREAVEKLSINTEDGISIKVTVSIGMAYWDEEEILENVIKNADCALYEAKRTGRNKVIQYSAD